MAIIEAMDTGRSDTHMKSLTDLHTHTLPGFDDGAKDLDTAKQMLLRQRQSGVDRVALTPHFYPLREEMDAFLPRRRQAYDLLMTQWDESTMPALKLGAEVRYSPQLVDMDLHQLTLDGGDYLLLELSDTRVPAHVEQVVDRMLMQGIIPVLAHVERCIYFRKEPERLMDLVQMGTLAQVSARAIASRKDQRFAKACLLNGLAHVIASDAHDLDSRNPCLATATEDLEILIRAEAFAQAVWKNEMTPAFSMTSIKKTVFGYK